MDGPGLTRAMATFGALPKMVAISGQLDAIIEFTSSRNNIAKDLKQALLKLRATVNNAKVDHERLTSRLAAAEKSEKKAPKSTQTDAFFFAGNSTMTNEAIDFAVGQKRTPALKRGRSSPEKGKIRPKRRRVSGQAERVRLSVPVQEGSDHPQVPQRTYASVVKSRERTRPGNSNIEKKEENKSSGKKGKQGLKPKHTPTTSAAQIKTKGEALIIKTEASQYAEVLRKMRADERLADLGKNVRSIRRTRTGEMLLTLKRGVKDQGPSYQKLAEEVVGNGVQVRSLGSTVTIQVKNLDEVTEVTELVAALKEQCQIEVSPMAITLRQGQFSTQVATVKLLAADAKKVAATGRVRVGWSVCPVSIPRPTTACFKCFGQGHLARDCKSTDRSKLCRRCGSEGHKAQGCLLPLKCAICIEGGKSPTNHMAGGPRCPGAKSVAQPCSR